jgi:hypothetical protein
MLSERMQRQRGCSMPEHWWDTAGLDCEVLNLRCPEHDTGRWKGGRR